MGTSVVDLINSGAKRRSPTTTDIVALASGSPSAATSGSRSKSAAKRSTSSKATRSKPPCKYGPRGADGYCPKKPRSSSPSRQTSGNRTRVTARTPGSATSQAIDVVTNPRASRDQKAAAVGKVAESVGGSAVKATAKRVAKSSRWQTAKQRATEIAKSVPVGGLGGPLVAAAIQSLKLMPSEAKLKAVTRARQRADAAVAAVEKKMKLTKKQRNVLLKQHIDYFIKNP